MTEFFKRYGQALPYYSKSPINNGIFFLNAVVQIKSVKELEKNDLEKDFKNDASIVAAEYNKQNPDNPAVFSDKFKLVLLKVPNDASTNLIKSSVLIFTLFSTFLAFNL